VLDVRAFRITSNRAAREFVYTVLDAILIRSVSEYNRTKISDIKLIHAILSNKNIALMSLTISTILLYNRRYFHHKLLLSTCSKLDA